MRKVLNHTDVEGQVDKTEVVAVQLAVLGPNDIDSAWAASDHLLSVEFDLTIGGSSTDLQVCLPLQEVADLILKGAEEDDRYSIVIGGIQTREVAEAIAQFHRDKGAEAHGITVEVRP